MCKFLSMSCCKVFFCDLDFLKIFPCLFFAMLPVVLAVIYINVDKYLHLLVCQVLNTCVRTKMKEK